jgi:hypothetical protein
MGQDMDVCFENRPYVARERSRESHGDSFCDHETKPSTCSIMMSSGAPQNIHIGCSTITTAMRIVHYYRKTEPPHSLLPSIQEELKNLGLVADEIQRIETESCFNVRMDQELSVEETTKLEWLLSETFDPAGLQKEQSWLASSSNNDGTTCWVVEFGPRMTFTSAFSSNAVSICQACHVPIERLELSKRYRFTSAAPLSDSAVSAIRSMLHDRMTEQEYPEPLTSFDSGAAPKPVKTVPIMEEGRAALERINDEMGLGFDDHDLDYYTELFRVRCCALSDQSFSLISYTLTTLWLARPCRHRTNSAATRQMWNALIWDSPTRSTRAIGSLAAK